MAGPDYKYRREDFGDLPVRLNHLTIYLNFLNDFIEARNCLDMTALQPLTWIELDAKDLEITSVEWLENPDNNPEHAQALPYEYLRERSRLIVRLPDGVQTGERFFVRTVTTCRPSDHILEGIYKDTTPAGAPQQYVSQCQQWGFQRIMPIFDDCRAKCTIRTTIEADRAYTHLITNGNVSRVTNPDGVPVPKTGDPGRQIITYENPIPMAPYLFVVCAGTWEALVDSVSCPSGQTIRLEYLVPPGRGEHARIPMEILKQAIPWIARTQDYEYSAETYRTICMNKSNFGGMENVGNTTIVTDAALIDEHTLDHSLMYAHGVIVHEFEHNQCGSETTMETPFDVWLNEAYTVDVERQFMADVFDPAFVRLNQLDSIRNPLLGPLAIEDGGHAGRIVREGFNNPDELIDGVTYVKAGEVIRMLRLILGADNFRAGKTLYFSRYRHSNANTDQFFQCFEEVSGRSLTCFKTGWLYRAGYPRVSAEAGYDAEKREYKVIFRQESEPGSEPFHLPIDLALVDERGRTILGTSQVFELQEDQAELVFRNISEPPAFGSFNRDYSFYGTFRQQDVSDKTLALQAKLDGNPFNRVEAFRQLTDRQRIKLLLEPDARIDPEWISMYGHILGDESLPPGLKYYLLRIDEQPLDRNYCTWFPELVVAMEKLMLAVNQAYRDKLVALFHRLDTGRPGRSPREGIEERFLKNVLLGLITIDDSAASHSLILDCLAKTARPAEKVPLLSALNRTSAMEREELLEQAYQAWHGHITGYANYLRVVASGTRPDLFHMVEREKARPTFDVNQPTWSRPLFLTTAANNKMIWTDGGMQWLSETIIWMSPINDYTAGRLMHTFQHYRTLKPDLQAKVGPALQRILTAVTDEISPSIHGLARAYLGEE